jgi:hypothetical protein
VALDLVKSFFYFFGGGFRPPLFFCWLDLLVFADDFFTVKFERSNLSCSCEGAQPLLSQDDVLHTCRARFGFDDQTFEGFELAIIIHAIIGRRVIGDFDLRAVCNVEVFHM